MNAPLAVLAPAPPALPLTACDGQLLHLPVGWIEVQPGFNPRTFFEDAEFADLVASVRACGVQQTLWVRPVPDYDPGPRASS
ncbi:MAG: hypothetical protein IPM75_15150 [Candidatus Competibacteraceae bacterium]|nr:hypothetical protein [Candidatus Competibacteraceae bacterium]